MIARRILLAALLALFAASAFAQASQFFRIGTGSTGGTYFPIGAILASAISNPPGSRDCERGGSCGVPGLIAVAQSTSGSVENVRALSAGTLESALSQADVAFWAYHGRHTFAESGPIKNLRAIANLYPEMIHIVVRRDAGILTVRDLKGKRVSLDREGSGTRVDAMLILEAYGLKSEDLTIEHLEPGPAAAITDLAATVPIGLVPINGPESERLRQTYPFFSTNYIPAGSYSGVYSTPTVSVGAQWLVSASVPEETVYGVTRALWHPSTEKLLDAGHAQGKHIRKETALDGIGIPLHPGAIRYYREVGLLP